MEDEQRESRYDVAFSFLAEDEEIAQSLALKLREGTVTFVYSNRQKELAGKDGLEVFTSVFGEQARVCVVLYRDGWGETKWTGVEETAIKDRAFEKGWEFLVVISLDGKHPKWLPRVKLWLGWDRFGPDVAVGVIDARIQETGGEVREETVEQRAKRLQAEADRRYEHQVLLKSQRGVDLAREALQGLFKRLKTKSEALAQDGVPIAVELQADGQVAIVRTPRGSVTFGWSQQYSNSLEFSSLLVRRLDGPYHPDGFAGGLNELDQLGLEFALDDVAVPYWREYNGGSRRLSNDALADEALKWLLDRVYSD
jgi:hypothetical protein